MNTKRSVWITLCLFAFFLNYSVTLTGQPNCNSYNEIDYEGCSGDGYSVDVLGAIYDESNPTGYIEFPGAAYNGCDSNIIINLVFNNVLNGEETYTGCIGDGYSVMVNGTIYDEVSPNGTELIVGASGCDSVITVNLIFENSTILEIVSTSPASCPDNNSTSACDKTCANSIISYTVPNSQNMDLEWEVLGAESYEVDNNLVTVKWGNPGVGEINVSSVTSSNPPSSGTPELVVDCVTLREANTTNSNSLIAAYPQYGTPPYSYQWSTGQTGQNSIWNLPSGEFSVTVTDATGNTSSCSTIVIQSACNSSLQISSILEITHVAVADCNANISSGSINLNVIGSAPPFSFQWSNGAMTEDVDNLAPSNYTVTITDDDNCTKTAAFEIHCLNETTDPCSNSTLFLNAYQAATSNPVSPTGLALSETFGGTPPYTYLWSTGVSTYYLDDIAPGSYTLIVTDANGCTDEATVSISESGLNFCELYPYIWVLNQDPDCQNSESAIAVEPLSGFPTTVLWSNNSTQETISNLSAGTYCVTVTNTTIGCTSQRCIDIPCFSTEDECIGEGSLCIDIIPEPAAQFTTTPLDVNGLIEVCRGETITFQNLSDDAENYVWELGDGYSTAAQNVTHAYTESGVYDVLLIARNECFCIDTSSVRVLVSTAVIPEIECVGTTCVNQSQTYTSSEDCSSYIWSVSSNGNITDGGGSTDDFITIDWGTGPTGEVSLQVSGCSGNICASPVSVSIPIITDAVLIDGPVNVCPGEVSTYSIPQWSATEYVWTTSNFGEIKSGQGSNTITVKWNVENAVLQQQWVHVEYNNCYLECGGESTKDVFITPDFYLSGPIETCENSSSEYAAFDEIQNNPVPCNWTVLDADGVSIWTSPSAAAVATINWPAGSGKYTLVASAVASADFCSPDYSIIVSTIAGPPAVAGITGLNSICPGEYYTYEVQANQPNVAYNWTINNGGSLSENTGTIINVQWGASPPYQLTVSQISTAGLACSSSDFSMTIDAINSISPEGPGQVCIESTHQYTAPAIGNASYQWDISPASAGTILSGQGSDTISVIWNEVGAAGININACGVTEYLPITIFGYPDPIAIHPDSICYDATADVSVASIYNSYSWRDEDGSEVSNSANPNLEPGYYELLVTNNAGCQGQTTFKIHPLPEPVINISKTGLNFYCTTAGLEIPTLFALNTDEGYTYEWFRNGISLNVFTDSYTPTQPGTFLVEVVDINGCTAQSNSIILIEDCGTIGGPPIPDTGAGCDEVSNTINVGPTCVHGIFENTTTNYLPGTIIWNFGDPASGAANTSNLENPEHFFSAAGYYPILMQITTLDSTICAILRDFEVPEQADFDIINNCPGEPVAFEDLSTFTPTSSIASWEWDFGDPTSGSANSSTEQYPTHIFENLGDYDVQLTVTAPSGCTSSLNKTVSILPPPVASFPLPNVSCAATGVAFEIDSNADITSFSWNFDDPASGAANTSRLASTFHSFSSPGNYDVQLKVFNIYGCVDSISNLVPITQNDLSGDIDLAPGSPICEGTLATISAPAGGSFWTWSNDNTTESFIQAETGTFEVTITDDNGCSYTPDPVLLDVIAEPEATIKVTEYNEFGQPADCFFNGYILCEGEDVFLSITGAGDYSYEWSNGQSGDEVIYDDEHDGTLSVGDHDFEVTVTDNITGCTSVEGPFSITVNPVPTDIEIASSPSGPLCELTNIAFTVVNPDSQLTYIWSTGEYGNTIIASTAGEYFVRAISGFGCEGESNRLDINAAPDINLVPDGCLSRCNPDTICLPNIPNIASFQWFLNDTPIAAPEGNSPDFIPTESGAYNVELTDNLGCFATSEPFNIDLLPLDTSTLQLGACEGDMAEYNGEELAPGSVTEFTYTNQFGCDSMITVSVIPASNYEEDLILSACEGSSVIYGNESYLTGTDTSFNLLTQFGCDSIINLQINGLPTSSETITLSTCSGTTVMYADEELEAGTSTDFTFINQFLCDSMVTVLVTENPTYQDTVSLEGCEGTMVSYQGVDYPAGFSQTFNFNTVAGCDSSVVLNIEALATYDEVFNLSTCEGFNITLPDGLTLAAGTDTTLFLSSQFGCDSTVQIIVEAVEAFEVNVDLEACEGSTVPFEGTDYPPGTDLEFNYTSQQGCDSTIFLSVATLPIQNDTVLLSACTGTTIEYLDEDLEPGTTTDFMLTNQFNCDSVVTVIVNEDQTYFETVNINACEGGTVIYEGTEYPAGSSQELNHLTVAGCDSIITLDIAALQTDENTVELSACPGETAEYNDDNLPAGSSNTYTFVNQYDCDSTVFVNVTELATQNVTIDLVTCDGQSVIFEGETYLAGTQNVLLYSNQFGCDSIINLNIAALPTYTVPVTLEACEGSTANYLDNDLPVGSITEFPYSTTSGCDSIIVVEVISYPSFSFELTPAEQICWNSNEGEIAISSPSGGDEPFEFSLDGFNYQTDTLMSNLEGGAYTVFVQDGNGCVQEQTISIPITAPIEMEFNVPEIACDSDSVIIQSFLLNGLTDSMVYQWQHDFVGPVAPVYNPGIYVLDVSNLCETKQFEIEVLLEDGYRDNYLYIPNAFSPNGDGKNDIFKAYAAEGLTVLSYELHLFDRWGNTLYTTTDIREGWDGVFLDEAMNPGVYVWWLRAKLVSCRNEIDIFDKGDVTIIK